MTALLFAAGVVTVITATVFALFALQLAGPHTPEEQAHADLEQMRAISPSGAPYEESA